MPLAELRDPAFWLRSSATPGVSAIAVAAGTPDLEVALHGILRTALLDASFRRAPESVAAELPALLVEEGEWTAGQAIDFILGREYRREEALIALSPHLPRGEARRALDHLAPRHDGAARALVARLVELGRADEAQAFRLRFSLVEPPERADTSSDEHAELAKALAIEVAYSRAIALNHIAIRLEDRPEDAGIAEAVVDAQLDLLLHAPREDVDFFWLLRPFDRRPPPGRKAALLAATERLSERDRALALVTLARHERDVLPTARAAVAALPPADRCFASIAIARLGDDDERRRAVAAALDRIEPTLHRGLSAEDEAAVSFWLKRAEYVGSRDYGQLFVLFATVLPRGERARLLRSALAAEVGNDGWPRVEALREAFSALREDASKGAVRAAIARAAASIRGQQERFYHLAYVTPYLTPDDLQGALDNRYPVSLTTRLDDWLSAHAEFAAALPAEQAQTLLRRALEELSPHDPRFGDACARFSRFFDREERTRLLTLALEHASTDELRSYPRLFQSLDPALPRALLDGAWALARRAVPPVHSPDLLLSVALAVPEALRARALDELIAAYGREVDVPPGSPMPFEDVAHLLSDEQLDRAIEAARGLLDPYGGPALRGLVAEMARRGRDPGTISVIARSISPAEDRADAISAIAMLARDLASPARLRLALEAVAIIEAIPDDERWGPFLDAPAACGKALEREDEARLAEVVSTVIARCQADARDKLLTESVLALLLRDGRLTEILAMLRAAPREADDIVEAYVRAAVVAERVGADGVDMLVAEAADIAVALTEEHHGRSLASLTPHLGRLSGESVLPLVLSVLRGTAGTDASRAGIIGQVLPFFERIGGAEAVRRALDVLDRILVDVP